MSTATESHYTQRELDAKRVEFIGEVLKRVRKVAKSASAEATYLRSVMNNELMDSSARHSAIVMQTNNVLSILDKLNALYEPIDTAGDELSNLGCA